MVILIIIIMVFYQLAFGMTVGMTTALSVKPIVYYTIADHLYYPHKRFYRFKKAKNKMDVTTPEEWEAYAVDVLKSFAMFWLVIGPVIQLAYFSPKPKDTKALVSEKIDKTEKEESMTDVNTQQPLVKKNNDNE